MSDNNSEQGNLFIISAPSGAGKTSLVKALCETMSGLTVSVSHTTRGMRTGEQNGREYHFVDVDTFKWMIADKDFIEYAQVFGNYYGTSASAVQEQLEQGLDVILEIDYQGAAQVREKFPEVASIFILPPSREILESRLRGRGTDSDEVIARRLSEAKKEMSHYQAFDYLVVNDDFNQAQRELEGIITSYRLRQAPQSRRLADIIAELLA
jgi:guanylate kinase